MPPDHTRPTTIARLARRCLALAALSPVSALAAQQAAPPILHQYREIALSPDGATLASIEQDDGVGTPTTLVLTDVASGARRTVALACGRDPDCVPGSPTWRPSGLAFLLARPDGTAEIDAVDPASLAATRLAAFDGPLDRLRAGPGGRLAVLATAHAHKKVGATSAARPLEGEIGTDIDEQRIAVLGNGALRMVSPADSYVYEFAWLPDGRGFVGTTAPGDGDSHWWIARLARFDLATGAAATLFTPGPREQLASPVVSPDGRTVGFIGGWMSDFGSTGGDAFLLPLAGGAPRDATPSPTETVTSLDWTATGLREAGIEDGADVSSRIDPAATAQRPAEPLQAGALSFSAGGWNVGLSCAASRCAAIRQGFATPPALVVADLGADGRIGAWRAITDANRGATLAASARSIDWPSDGDSVQGWLLVPTGGAGPRALVVDVHGGPEAAAEPRFPADDTVRALIGAGDAILMPNYRGSFGHGERFAAGSIHDVGGGDWRDVLRGVDAAERATAIDDRRLGIIGGSYGGYMAMWAVAQTHRFAAAVAIAGVSDWLSIEGEAPEAGADATNFGASVYDDPRPYLAASPVMHIRGARTPSLVLVGDRDAECPMPQSQEFATALTALRVPVSFVVYKGEGHGMTRPEDRRDETRRVVAWFGRWLR